MNLEGSAHGSSAMDGCRCIQFCDVCKPSVQEHNHFEIGEIHIVRLAASMSSGAFPPPPIAGDELLITITSWEALHVETRVTGIEFEQYWFDSVEDQVAYFFKWLGEPRSTVLVIWTVDGPTHIECRTFGDRELDRQESNAVIAAVIMHFRNAGYWPNLVTQ